MVTNPSTSGLVPKLIQVASKSSPRLTFQLRRAHTAHPPTARTSTRILEKTKERAFRNGNTCPGKSMILYH